MMKPNTHLYWIWLIGCSLTATTRAGWEPAKAPLMTRWAKEVTPQTVHPEYPRPQMVRSNWLNLNGLWDYAIRDQKATVSSQPAGAGGQLPGAYEGQILVPFPLESALSGVMKRLDENSVLWYHRSFEIPPAWKGQRVLLHFGAVDWQAKVIVNGQEVGTHRGGYDDFTLEVTGELRSSCPQELVVAVMDPTEADQPRGKQSRKPEGIFYTPASGIWQTVWLEPVPPAYIVTLKLVPDVDRQQLRLRVGAEGTDGSCQIEAVVSAEGRELVRANGALEDELAVVIERPQLWSPDRPYLYDLEVKLRQGSRVVDAVTSYFGLRKISLSKDEQGIERLMLNQHFLFQVGTLDQGFWPDGIYTAPTDAGLRSDLEVLKQMGFNLTRKHVKVEPERWYYWCDKLGVLVWQDMPSGNNGTAAAKRQFETELQRMIAGKGNHPSVIMWVVFNEGWGQYDTERLTEWVRKLDSSRLVNNASGWTDKKVGDVIDMHNYPGPGSPLPEAARAAVLGEFGGLGLGIAGHTWSQQTWGYQGMSDSQRLTTQYLKLLRKVWALKEAPGLSAAVYTQTTDVETECNGLLTYDRECVKVDAVKVSAANRGQLPRAPQLQPLVATAQKAPVLWRYTLQPPGPDWFKPEYADDQWRQGPAGFGTEGTPGAMVRTEWKSPDIWLRREFELPSMPMKSLQLMLHHDEDVEVYLNGVLAAKLPGFTTDYEDYEIAPAATAALKPGQNHIAVHCHQTQGGQYIDAGLVNVLDQP